MRSNDAHTGLPHDVFCFTMLQEVVARAIGADVGRYIHMVGSLHLYDDDTASAERFLAEGWFSTAEMLPMPEGNPMPALNQLVEAEAALRGGRDPMDQALPDDPYWSDLTNLLVVLALDRQSRTHELAVARSRMNSQIFNVHIDDRLERRRDNP
jgi:thymidylate synthase